MENTQIILTIVLLIVEVVAFAWLIQDKEIKKETRQNFRFRKTNFRDGEIYYGN